MVGRNARRTAATVIAIAGLLAAVPTVASAASVVTLAFSQLQLDAAAGESNRLTVTTADGQIIFSDTADTITSAVVGCLGSGSNTLTCTIPDLNSFEAALDDLDDIGTTSGPLPGEFSGQEGPDQLTAGSAESLLRGGAGDDQLTGGSGDDRLDGEEGHDTIVGNAGDDSGHGCQDGVDGDNVSLGEGDDAVECISAGNVIDLGPGDDRFFYTSSLPGGGRIDGGTGIDEVNASAPVALIEDLAGGVISQKEPAPPVQTVTNFEDLRGGSALGDTVTGTNGANVIDTSSSGGGILVIPDPPRSGNDVVNPLAGADLVSTGEGNDQIMADDGFSDRVNCGLGTDAVRADQLDTLIACETATIVKARPAGADRTAPVCTFTSAAKKAKRSKFAKSYSATFRCNEKVTAVGRIVLSAKRSGGRLKLAKAGDVTLAEKSTTANANSKKKLTLKISRKLRSSLPKKFTARVLIDARDEFGNRKTITRKVKVSTPKRKGK